MDTKEKPQKVKVIAFISGNYASFDEISIIILYDITNDLEVEENKEESLKALSSPHDMSETKEVDMLLYKGKYYLPV